MRSQEPSSIELPGHSPRCLDVDGRHKDVLGEPSGACDIRFEEASRSASSVEAEYVCRELVRYIGGNPELTTIIFRRMSQHLESKKRKVGCSI
jgi:hypothetical protein